MNGITVTKFLNALIIFSVLFLYIAKSTNAESDSYLDSNFASKRRQTSQTSGLIPFPRIGRASQRTWKSRMLEQIKRREGLIPFPRVGRSGKLMKARLPEEFLTAGHGSRYIRDFQRPYPATEDQWISSVMKELNEDNELPSKFNQNEINDEPDLDNDGKGNLESTFSD